MISGGTSIFDRIASFSNVSYTKDECVETASFVSACDGLATVFDSLGVAFAFVKSDIVGNIAKVRAKQEELPHRFTTLQSIVKNELSNQNTSKSTRTATEGLLWLKRTLDFTHQGLKMNWESPTNEELSVSLTKSYQVTLAPYHSVFVQPLFTMTMKACPSRADFYNNLGITNAKSRQQFQNWLNGLGRCVYNLNEFYERNGISKDAFGG
ncbi:glycolipid transfer protein domain-containing protein [Obelidium mucronatum]|nr:glycolipid transfer protein domain-containing protein [Obelidium mucronatum]